MSQQTAVCPHCAGKVRHEQRHVGRTINCPGCHKPFEIPETYTLSGSWDDSDALDDLPENDPAPPIPRRTNRKRHENRGRQPEGPLAAVGGEAGLLMYLLYGLSALMAVGGLVALTDGVRAGIHVASAMSEIGGSIPWRMRIVPLLPGLGLLAASLFPWWTAVVLRMVTENFRTGIPKLPVDMGR